MCENRNPYQPTVNPCIDVWLIELGNINSGGESVKNRTLNQACQHALSWVRPGTDRPEYISWTSVDWTIYAGGGGMTMSFAEGELDFTYT